MEKETINKIPQEIEEKKNDKYNTPDFILNWFEDWFDPCPVNPQFNGLKIEWKDKTYVNPPYSNPLPWVLKGIEENKNNKRIAFLLRADTSTRYFSELINAGATILFFFGRLSFKNQEWSYDGKQKANFASMLCILSKSKLTGGEE
jgi:hypothetical protein